MRSIILQVYLVYSSGLEEIAVIRKESYDALFARFHKLMSGKDIRNAHRINYVCTNVIEIISAQTTR